MLAYFGGVPLAFVFIATLGAQGLITKWLDGRLGVSNSFLFGVGGIMLVYLYFQIPLMVLVIFPALEGLRPQWREAGAQPGREPLAVLALRRRPAARAAVPRCADAVVRQRFRRLRDRAAR